MQEEKNILRSSFSLLYFIWTWKKPILIVCVAAAILSFGISLLIAPVFKATTIVYAPRTNSIAKILVNEENYNERLDVKAYATADETEQMMQVLNSRDILDSLIVKFNLLTHYDIKTNSKYWETNLYKTIKNNIKIQRTQFGAISISVLDQSPQFAADMANEISNQLDLVKNRIEHARAEAAYQLLLKQCKRYDDEIARINDSIKVVMEHGVFEYATQSERLQQQRAIAVAQGNGAAIQRLDKELANLAVWGPKAMHLQEYLILYRNYQAVCQSKLLDAQMDLDNEMPVKFVMEKAIVPDKKDSPKKLMITIVSTVGTFILSIFVLLMMQNVKSRMAVARKEDGDNE